MFLVISSTFANDSETSKNSLALSTNFKMLSRSPITPFTPSPNPNDAKTP